MRQILRGCLAISLCRETGAQEQDPLFLLNQRDALTLSQRERGFVTPPGLAGMARREGWP